MSHQVQVGGEGEHLLQLAEVPGEGEPVAVPCTRGSCTVHDEWLVRDPRDILGANVCYHHPLQVHGSRGNLTSEWRHTYVTAFRHQDMVAYERQRGFRHSYRDTEALQRLRRTKAQEARGGSPVC